MHRSQPLCCVLHTLFCVLHTLSNASAWIIFYVIVLPTYCLSNLKRQLHICPPNTCLLTIPLSVEFMHIRVGCFPYACIHLARCACGSSHPSYLSVTCILGFPKCVRIILLHSRQSSKLPLCVHHHLVGVLRSTQFKA